MTQQEIDQIRTRQRLLDAAPALLEACEQALAALGDAAANAREGRPVDVERERATLRAALSLARGGK